MTVAAIILARSAESALELVEGLARVRRLADVAWSGGAVPIVVVAPDPDGLVAAALAGAPVTLAEPAPMAAGPVGQIVRGIDVAAAEVTETDGALIWPVRLSWVDPETVTSLIELHGRYGGDVLRPTFADEAGWPALLPIEHLSTLRALGVDRLPDDLLADLATAGVPQRELDLGDPGTTIDGATPRAEMPPYEGPPGPQIDGGREWGAAAADVSDDAPLEGPALAPFAQAAGDDVPPTSAAGES